MSVRAAINMIEAVLVVSALFGTVFGIFWFMEERHAQKSSIETIHADNFKTELEIRSLILDLDIDRKSEIRHHYKRLESNRDLEPAEEARVEYLEEQLSRQYSKQDMLQEQVMKMEQESP